MLEERHDVNLGLEAGIEVNLNELAFPTKMPNSYHFQEKAAFSRAALWQCACTSELKKCILDCSMGS